MHWSQTSSNGQGGHHEGRTCENCGREYRAYPIRRFGEAGVFYEGTCRWCNTPHDREGKIKVDGI